jgi:uncharacterized membrane protein YdbT with pleckstrin-like domain
VFSITVREDRPIPIAARDYLMPREKVVLIVRQHPVSLARSLAVASVALLAASTLSATFAAGNGPVEVVLWVLSLIALGFFAYRYLDWRLTFFIVTSNRLILITGLLDRSIGMLPLTKVTDMRLVRTLIGRSLGYAQFVIESAGQDQALRTVDFVPYPVSLYQQILQMIFPESEQDNPNPAERVESDPGY